MNKELNDTPIGYKTVEELKKKKLVISTAESCTGGLLASCIVSVAGDLAAQFASGGTVGASFNNSIDTISSDGAGAEPASTKNARRRVADSTAPV